MASEHQSGRPSHEVEQDDNIAAERGGQSDTNNAPVQATIRHKDAPERPRSPAYVAPIPKIGGIPQVTPGIPVSDSARPQLPSSIASLLVGKLVDEDGDIIDEKTGQVLAHAAGDLPSMVGRKVSNTQGDILGDDGELLGYVADIEWPRAGPPPPAAPPRSLFDLMGRARSSLMVDHAGNILDADGNVVGRFHDNNNPLHRKEKEEREARERMQTGGQRPQPVDQQAGGGDGQQGSPPPTPSPQPQHQQQQDQHQEQEQSQPQSQSQPPGGEDQSMPRRTEGERRQNAEAWRKENPNESPSDIFLDVKSTREGIQLTIRIPTVFNGQQTTPHISFS